MENKTEQEAKMSHLTSLDAIVVNPIDPVTGWSDIDKTSLSYEALLYPESYRFQIKPVTAGTVKYFSGLDENNPISVNDALSYVVENHIRVLDGNKMLKALDVIYEHDRFKFVMLVHLWSGATTTLSFTGNCTHTKCGHQQSIDITAEKLQYSELTAKGKSWLNNESGYFVIETASMGTRYFRPLTLNESTEIVEFIQSKRQKGLTIEPLFLQYAGFYMHDRKHNESIEELYQTYLKATSNIKEVSLLQGILEHITVKQLFEVLTVCKSCDNPFQSRITSVEGLRNIFLVHDIAGELQ